MSRILRSALALGAVFFALAITACGGNDVPSGDVAKVDNYTISKDTFNRWFKLASASNGASAPDAPTFVKCIAAKEKAAPKPAKGQPKPKRSDYLKQCQAEYDQLKQQVMTFLVRSTWLEAEANRQGVKVSDAEAKTAFQKAVKSAFPKKGDYAKFLKSSGQTEADLIYRQTVQLLEKKITDKIQSEAKKPSESDVEAYYQKNLKKQFTQPASRDLRVVLTNNEKDAQKAKDMLDSGSSWVRVVHDYSTDPTTKDADGVLPNVTQGVGNPEFERAVFSAKPDTIVGPVKTSDGYYVFTVTKATPGKVAKLKDVKPSIEAIINQQRRQTALAKFGQDYTDRWRGLTDCAKGYVSPDCSQSKPQRNSTVPPGAIPQQTPGQSGPVPATSAQPQVPQGQQQQQQP
jgi:foldase protein PrsA